jgi:hypothetical protein
VTASREEGLCFTADCNELPPGQHHVYCPEFWQPIPSSPSVAFVNARVFNIPSAPSSLRNIPPSLLNDILHYIRADPTRFLQQLDNVQPQRRNSLPIANSDGATLLSADEPLASLVRQGYGYRSGRLPRTETRQPRRPSSAVNNMFTSLHTQPRQAVERADVIEEDMDARRASRRAGRNNRGRNWPVYRYGSGCGVMR